MAYIDEDSAKELVSKHKKLFQNIASKGDFETSLIKIVGKAYLVMLLIKSILIGSAWWMISLADPFYGTFFLLVVSLIQAKMLLDRDFKDVGDNLITAARESGIVDSEKKDIDASSENIEKSDKKSCIDEEINKEDSNT